MGRLLDSNQFSRDNKKGLRLTFRQRAPSAGVAERIIRTQSAAQFPVKAGDIEVLSSEEQDQIIGPFSTYTVDIFVPVSNLQGERIPSGDISLPDST